MTGIDDTMGSSQFPGAAWLDAHEVLEALADPIVAADSTGHILYSNCAVERLLGWEPNSLSGQPISVLIPERLRPAHVAGFARFIDTRTPTIMRTPVRVPALHRDASEIDIELTLTPIDGPDGVPVIVASLRDLRERTELERQLAITRYLRASTEAASRLTSLLDLHEVARAVVQTMVDQFDAQLARIWIYDGTTTSMHLYAQAGNASPPPGADSTHLESFQLPPWLEVVVQTGQPYIVPDLSALAEKDTRWLTERGCTALGAFPLLIGGETRGVLVHFTQERMPEEVTQILCNFASIVATSITDVHRFQQEQLARAVAEEAEGRYAFLAQASTVLAESLDLQTTLANLAHITVRYLADWCIVDTVAEDGSIERVEIAHREPKKLSMVAEYQRYNGGPSGSRAILQVLRTGQPVLVSDISDEQIEGAAQDAAHLELLRGLELKSFMAVPMRTRDHIVGVITLVSTQPGRVYGDAELVLAQDLASRAASAIDNASLYRAAREAIQTRNEFISTVSHDLKNPIAAIKGRAQILHRRLEQMDVPDRDKCIEGLENIDANATRMVRFLSNLVDVARTTHGSSVGLDRTPTDLVALALGVVNETQSNSPAHAITVDAACSRLVGDWDSTRIERVVTNLVGNAVKYSPQGTGVEVRIDRETDAGEAWAVLTVRDHGLGIPVADMGHIFDRYHRGSNVISRIPGTGLGLSGAKQIAEQHGGTIGVESTEGEGSMFTLRLPLECTAES